MVAACVRGVVAASVALAVLAPAADARAAGFALKEQSASALGYAFAGATAAAEDASFAFFNPAAFALQPDRTFVAVASVIAPRSELRGASASTVLGTPIGGRTHRGDIAKDAFVPALYAGWRVVPEITLGLQINAPFGLETGYPGNWVGRYHAIDSMLRTVTVTPTVAVKPTSGFAFGIGLQVQHAKARLTNAIDFGTIGAAAGIPGAVPNAQDGRAELEGDSLGVGLVAGLLWEPWEGTRLGVGYRSRVRHNLRGDVDFTPDGAGIAATLSALTGRFVDTGAEARVTLPDQLSVGLHQELGEDVAVVAEAQLTRWSLFDELRIRFDNPAEADSVTGEHWEDSWFFAVGALWRPTDALTVRLGAAHDQTPIRNRYRTPRIPDNDRWWLAAGLSWRVGTNVAVDLAYTHILVEDSRVRLSTAGIGNTFRGNLTARYDSAIDIVTLAGRITW